MKLDFKSRKGKKVKRQRVVSDGVVSIIDKLNLDKYMEQGVKQFKERLKFITKQAMCCRNLEKYID